MQAPELSPGRRKQDILRQALMRKTPLERAAFLEDACSGDAALRVEMNAWLAAVAENQGDAPLEAGVAGIRIEEGTTEATPTLLDETPRTEGPGTVIGRYKLLEQIGEGGFGVVHMAEQRAPVKRRVAMKIIKLGMDTRQVVARFEAERQSLALMDHPNIAKVFDAGATEAGRPYFVMELVRGIRITDYCDQNSLSTKERLDLFLKVCQAIQHAHQKGIIHRDIKPSNILVTLQDGVPVPKVIDFGIAKAVAGQTLTDKTLFTALEQFIGTPAYMSPEQAEMSGLDIDTRSDIYSLGVLLYELLAGSTPFDAKELMASGIDAMRKTIREKEPQHPSTRLATLGADQLTTTAKRRSADASKLLHQLAGDLDWIVMKCLEKDRTRRYDTANGLCMDIQRHLNNEPVVARPPSVAYRVQKFVRRNKVIVAAGATIAVVLVLGVVATTWEAVRATRLRQRAEANQHEATQAKEKEKEQRYRAETQELAARQRAYSSDMVLAQQALAENNLGTARELLKRQKPLPGQADLRGWEWRYVWSGTQGDDLFKLTGHSDDVTFALFLDDGRTIFSGSADRTIKFWDLEKRSLTESIPYPDDPWRAAVSPDGRQFAVGGLFGLWSVFESSSRQLLFVRTNAAAVVGLAFSRDGLKLAVADVHKIEIWSVGEGRMLTNFALHPADRVSDTWFLGLAFSPDGESIAYTYGGSSIQLRDIKSGSERTVGPSAHGNAVSLAFSADGRLLVSADRVRISVWDPTGQIAARYLEGHKESVICVAFSPDGRLLASASGDQSVKLWDTQTWKELATLHGHEHEVYSVAFSPDGKLLISCGKDQTIRAWSMQRPKGPRDSLVLSKGRDFDFGRPYRDRLLHLFESTAGAAATFLDLGSLEESAPQAVPPGFLPGRAFALNRSGGVAALASDEGPIALWHTDPFSRVATVAPSKILATALGISGSGRWLAVQRTNETTEIWDLQSQLLFLTLEPLRAPVRDHERYKALSFWAGDRFLVRATTPARDLDPLLQIVALPGGKSCVIEPKHKGIDTFANFAISDDGTLLATAGWDARVKLFDVRSGHVIETLTGQLIGFLGLAFSPDGSRLAAGGWDGTVTLWDVSSRLQVAKWKAHGRACHWLCFVHGGGTLASMGESAYANGQNEIRLWRAPSWPEIQAAEKAQVRRQ